MTEGGNRLAALLGAAQDGLEWLAGELAAAATGPIERDRALRDELAPLLAGLGPVAREQYVKVCAKVFGVSAKAAREALAPAQAETPGQTSGADGAQGGAGNGSQGGGYPAATLEALEEMGRRHFVINTGGTVWVGKRVLDPVSGEEDYEFGTFGDHTRFYCNRRVWVPDPGTGGLKSDELPKVWLRAPAELRPEFEGLVFSPGLKAPDTYLNLWRGLALDPVKGDCGLYWEHVRRVICLGNDELYSYVRRWMAHAVQRPWEIPGVALVLRGLQGTGKGCFATYFGELFGRHFLPVASMDLVSGRFNSHLKDVLVLFADEALWGGDKSRDGLLKALVTEPWLTIEGKGKDAIRVQNFKRLIVATNNSWPLPRDKDDRRTVVIDIDGDRKEDRDWFGAIHRQMREHGGLAALLWDLQHEDLEGFDPGQRPSVDHGFDMKLRSASPTIQWWHECLVNECNTAPRLVRPDLGKPWSSGDEDPREEWDGDPWSEEPQVDDLHKLYLRWGERLHLKYLESREQWARTLREVVPHLKVVRPRSGERRRLYQVGPVDACRKAFSAAFRSGDEIWLEGDGVREEPL